MRRAALAVALVLAAGCSPTPEAPAPASTTDAPPAPAPVPPAPEPPVAVDPVDAWDNRLGNLPPDAAAVIDRVEGCRHFAGEDIAAREEGDRKVAEATIAELKCDTVDADAVAVRAMYGDRPDVMEALDLANSGIR